MIDVALYHCIGTSVSRRASLLARLTHELTTLNARDVETRTKLEELVPEDLREWLDSDGLLSVLYEHGRCDFKIHFGEGKDFTSYDDIKEKMRRLGKAWKGVVTIKIKEHESSRVRVYFIADM
jgi:hypothetical protein